MRSLVYPANSWRVVFYLIAGKLMGSIRIEFLFVKRVNKSTGKMYFEFFPEENVWKIFWGIWQNKIEPDPQWGGKTQKSEQGHLSGYNYSANRKQDSGPIYSRHKMQGRGGAHTLPTYWFGNMSFYSSYMLGNNLNTMETFHWLMLVSSSGHRWVQKIELSLRGIHKHARTHTHTKHRKVLLFAVVLWASSIHICSYSNPPISDNIPSTLSQ